MTRHSFNVLQEPWIPVIGVDGSRGEMGILSCLKNAQDLREIRDPSPIVEFGLYRILVAFLLDALILDNRRPEDPLDLKSLIRKGRFDLEFIETYLQKCGDVFDLFHSERPFLQTKMKDKKPKPLAGMYPVVPSGTNAGHWHHFHEDDFGVSPSDAARLLATIAPFMTAGGAGLSPSINGAPAIYALPMGKNLFETLVLNLPLRTQDPGRGEIAWRNKRSPGGERSEATTVESLTWRPRQIQLIPEIGESDSVIVRKMKYDKGDSTRFPWIDSNLAYRYDKENATPVRMREDRPLWRDAGPLLLLNDRKHGSGEKKISFQRPDAVEHAFAAVGYATSVVIQAYGMRTDMKMKVFEWTKCVWSVPTHLGQSTRLGSLVQEEMDRADQCAFHLRNAIKGLYPGEVSKNKNALGTLVKRCERSYWQGLEVHFHPLMKAFSDLDPEAADHPEQIASTASRWRKAIQTLAIQQFEIAAEDMDADSDALERQVKARSRLKTAIRKEFS